MGKGDPSFKQAVFALQRLVIHKEEVGWEKLRGPIIKQGKGFSNSPKIGSDI